MESVLDKSKPLEGRRFRFVVKSADEAVHLIKKHLGDRARVLSVRQIDGKGLQRFLSSPKLEVIATVPKADEALPEAEEGAESTQAANSAKAPIVQEPPTSKEELSQSEELANIIKQNAQEQAAEKEDAESGAYQLREPSAKNVAIFREEMAKMPDSKSRKHQKPKESQLSGLLRKVHFDDTLVSRLECSPHWDKLEGMPINRALGEVYSILSDDYSRLDRKPLGQRVAFIGTPSVGKTTALCKQLASEVFIHGKKVNVLKLENNLPNPDDALRVFCDVLGVPLLRDPADLDLIPEGELLYVDTPGTPASERQEWQRIQERLNALSVESRVLVMNAAYDNDTIKNTYLLGHRQQATHAVFTHIDELNNHTKLWHYLLCGGLPALFYSHGQNVTSDYSEHILEFMMDKTFPSALAG